MNLNINFIDLIIFIVVLYFIIQGVKFGFWIVLSNFLSFLGSLFISLRYYRPVSGILKNILPFPRSISNTLGFLLTAIITEVILGMFLGMLVHKIPKKYSKNAFMKFLSIFPSLGEALIIISFILILIISLPITPELKNDISSSSIGSGLIKGTQEFEIRLKNIFGEAVEDSLTYIVIRPETEERVILQAKPIKLEIDEKTEKEMVDLVNNERRNRGIKELKLLPEAIPVARDYAKDMWERKYFSHISLEGEDVSDRLEKAGIKYFIVGENLALAPTLKTAHLELMNSERHRENILNQDFEKIAIGVIDNGIYGKMFVQIFVK